MSKDKFDASKIRLALINLDITGFSYRNTQKLKISIKNEFNIPEHTIFCFSTHSHYSPDTEGLMVAPIFPNTIWQDADPYLIEFIIKQTIKAIKMAIMNLREVKIGYGNTQIKERFIGNRRPPKGYYEIIHPRLHIIKFESLDKKIIGVIGIFPAHPVMVDREYNEISGGWPGYFVRYMKEKIKILNKDDLNVIPLIFQGPSGDVSGHFPLRIDKENKKHIGKKQYQYLQEEKLGEFLAECAYQILPKINSQSINKFIINSKEIFIPITPIYKGFNKSSLINILVSAIKRIIIVPGLMIFKRKPFITYVNLKMKRPKNKVLKRLMILTNVNTIYINDFFIVTNPGEPFYRMEKEIKQRANYHRLILTELCNDYVGYNWSDINRIYQPKIYDIEMTFSQYTGILTRNTALKEIKEILSILK